MNFFLFLKWFELSLLWHCISKLQFHSRQLRLGSVARARNNSVLIRKGFDGGNRVLTESVERLGERALGWTWESPLGTAQLAPAALQPSPQSSGTLLTGCKPEKSILVTQNIFK